MNINLWNEIVQQAHILCGLAALLVSLTILLYTLISSASFRSKQTVGPRTMKWKPYLHSGHHITDVRS